MYVFYDTVQRFNEGKKMQISENMKGIIAICLAMFSFMTVNSISKDVIGKYDLFQVIFFRCSFALIPISFLIKNAGGSKILSTNHLKNHIAISIIGVIALFGLFGCLARLPLADATTITFSETIILTALSAVILKEKVEINRWIAVLVGFIGVLIMMRPTGDVFNVGALFGIAFAIGDSAYMLHARFMSTKEHSLTTVFYFTLFISLICGFFLPFVWIDPNVGDLIDLMILGIGGGIGQVFITYAYKHASPSTLAPMIYTALLWATFYGYVFWDEVPDKILLLGATLIVGSGLYIILHSTRKKAAF